MLLLTPTSFTRLSVAVGILPNLTPSVPLISRNIEADIVCIASPSSLKLNAHVRDKVFGSLSSLSSRLGRLRIRSSRDDLAADEDDLDGGLALPDKQKRSGSADNHHFDPDPLVVPAGVAVTEESVELGEADVITQV
jgi:hypothetical protein